MYKSLLENRSSRAKARIFSPASIRLTIPSLNARLKTRCDDFGLDIRSPMENCPLFSVSHFWGALQRSVLPVTVILGSRARSDRYAAACLRTARPAREWGP